MRRSLPLILGAAVAAFLAIGVFQATRGGETEAAPAYDLQSALVELRGAPKPLADLHAQANDLVDGDVQAWLDDLEGHPVVVNKWASWCGPCRAEFPIFQRVATDLGTEVAFLGINAGDNRDDARAFLEKFPLPFPSLVDPSEAQAREIGLAANYPMTAFFDARGKRVFVHQGQYRNEADLRADIERYAR